MYNRVSAVFITPNFMPESDLQAYKLQNIAKNITLTLKKSKIPMQQKPKAASYGLMSVMLENTAVHVLRNPRPGT